MKKISLLSFAFIFAMTPIFAVNFALAASTYVDTNISYSPGDSKDGTPLDVSRTDPTKALGMEDGEFVSLGYGGEIVLAFPTHIGGGALAITAYERTNGDYPLEEANVYVSSNNTDWTFVGIANNLEDGELGKLSTFDLGDHCIKYVKLVDITDGDVHDDNSDGYDLDAVGATYEAECAIEEEEEETCMHCESGDSVVRNNNLAFVVNNVYSRSNTGANFAGGSYGGDGGDGGVILSDEVDESSTGAGGNGGDSGIGGTVISGNAYSTVDAYNEVNSNRTLINRCACETDNCCDGGDSLVVNRNRAIVMNKVGADSDTGYNTAEGSFAGYAGDGGNIGGDNSELDESSTGNGGQGGNSSDGGLVQSGESRSNTTFVNIVNRTLTRILR